MCDGRCLWLQHLWSWDKNITDFKIDLASSKTLASKKKNLEVRPLKGPGRKKACLVKCVPHCEWGRTCSDSKHPHTHTSQVLNFKPIHIPALLWQEGWGREQGDPWSSANLAKLVSTRFCEKPCLLKKCGKSPWPQRAHTCAQTSTHTKNSK